MEYFVHYWLPILTSLVALASLIYTIKHQSSIDDKAEQRLEKEQASKVSAWESHRENYQIIRNGSQTPVYNLYIFMCFNQDDSELKELLKKTRDAPNVSGNYYETFPPGDQSVALFDSRAMGNQHNLPALVFTDNQNIKWYRHANGYLERLNDFDYLAELQRLGIIFSHIE